MYYIDHPILYSDDFYSQEWQELVDQSQCNSSYWRRYARRKMRRISKELMKGVRPRMRF
jgi:hypothetical protein